MLQQKKLKSGLKFFLNKKMYKIYHNPRCSKSRQALQILRENNVEPEIIEYLKNPLTEVEIREILEILGKTPIEICRTGEKIFKELDLTKNSSDEELISAMAKNPILIERAIVIKNNKKGVLGRPPENVEELF